MRPNATIINDILIHKAFFHFLFLFFFSSIYLSTTEDRYHTVNNLPIVFLIVPDIVSTRHKSITVARRTLAYNAFRKTLPGCRKHRFYAHSIFRDLRSRNNSSGKELRGMGNKIRKTWFYGQNLFVTISYLPRSSNSIDSIFRASDTHIRAHVIVDKYERFAYLYGTFVHCVQLSMVSVDKFANENIAGKSRFCSKNSLGKRMDIKGKFHEPPATIHLFFYCLNPIIGRAHSNWKNGAWSEWWTLVDVKKVILSSFIRNKFAYGTSEVRCLEFWCWTFQIYLIYNF